MFLEDRSFVLCDMISHNHSRMCTHLGLPVCVCLPVALVWAPLRGEPAGRSQLGLQLCAPRC